ncbi:hypothetical protein C8F04DRAFT_1174434 [Mycena alexandri]|uniref:Uncharacterized protein n=1 Tax=Mycena alexandri TaxID=1745969 RepID=A0AAD6XC99_9AGAR|nr:hypothetical protein C8F04DRAFT_1174434 [Mycena alexandri]
MPIGLLRRGSLERPVEEEELSGAMSKELCDSELVWRGKVVVGRRTSAEITLLSEVLKASNSGLNIDREVKCSKPEAACVVGGESGQLECLGSKVFSLRLEESNVRLGGISDSEAGGFRKKKMSSIYFASGDARWFFASWITDGSTKAKPIAIFLVDELGGSMTVSDEMIGTPNTWLLTHATRRDATRSSCNPNSRGKKYARYRETGVGEIKVKAATPVQPHWIHRSGVIQSWTGRIYIATGRKLGRWRLNDF